MPDYYRRADVWPLKPQGKLLVFTMIESVAEVHKLNGILKNVAGIGWVLMSEGDLSQALRQRNYKHPEVRDAMKYIVETCKNHGVLAGHPHVTSGNVEELMAEATAF